MLWKERAEARTVTEAGEEVRELKRQMEEERVIKDMEIAQAREDADKKEL